MSRVLATPPAGSGLDPVMGHRGLPFIGGTLTYIRDPLRLWRAAAEQYGSVSWMMMAGRRVVTVLGPDGCQKILLNHDKAFSNELGWRPLIGPFFDNGLMLMDFDEHRQHRRLLQQAFTKKRLSTYSDAMQPVIENTIEQWQTGPDFQVYPATKALTLRLATEVFMGGTDDGDARMDRVNRAFIDCVQAATAIVRLNVPGGRWRRGLKGRAYLESFLREYLPSRRAGNGEDIFSVLAHIEDENGERFDDDAIIDHMMFLLMAAHDTSTLTISTMVAQLGKNAHWQGLCRQQSLAVGSDISDASSLAGLTALDAVMKESLRLLAPLPTMARWTVRDTEVDGHFIPKDVMVVATPHYTHHMESYWPNADVFDPSRFDGSDLGHKFAWQPFGGGAHTCIGQFFSVIEVKMVMHHLLRSFEWTVPGDYETPVDFTSLPFPKDGQPVDLRRR